MLATACNRGFQKKIYRKGRFCNNARLILALCIASVLASSFPVRADPLAHRQELMNRLDSIEQAKQEMKRLGRPLLQLEELEKAVKDSIVILRSRIDARKQVVVGTPRSDTSESYAFPHDAFDWFLVVLGGIALISALLLFIGIIQSIVRGRKRPRRAPMSRPDEKSSVSSVPVPPEKALVEQERFRLMREQIDRNKKNEQKAERGHLTPQVPSQPMGSERDGETRKQVIQAAAMGMGHQEIARRYRLSVDEVILILKVGRKG